VTYQVEIAKTVRDQLTDAVVRDQLTDAVVHDADAVSRHGLRADARRV
jgi:hypothetical protein